MPPGPRPAPAGSPPGLFDSLRHLLGALAGYVSARLELAGLESGEAFSGYGRALVFLVVALVGLIFGYFFFVLGLAFLVQAFTEWSWIVITTAFGAAHFLLALVCGYGAYLAVMRPAFPETLAELRKDRDWLTRELPMRPDGVRDEPR